MNKITLFFVVISLMINLSGCMTMLEYAKTLPPEINVREDEKSIQYFSKYDVSALETENEKKNAVYYAGMNSLKSGLLESFETDPNFDLFVFDSITESGFRDNSFTDAIPFLCSRNGTDMLLSLEKYDAYFDKEIEVEEDGEGNRSKTANYYLVVEADLALRNAKGELIHRGILRNEKYYKSRGVIIANMAIAPMFAKAKDDFVELSKELGRGYVHKLYPNNIIVTRAYYTGKDLKTLKPMAKSQQWEEAIRFLFPLTKSEDEKLAKRAAYNLYIIYEALGEDKLSDQWLQKSGLPVRY